MADGIDNRTAWFCPSCQKHHAPHVETCPGSVDLIGTKVMPSTPWPAIQPWPFPQHPTTGSPTGSSPVKTAAQTYVWNPNDPFYAQVSETVAL